MKKFSDWAESHAMATVKGQVSTDRADLGTSGFEGMQDIMDALKLVARSNPQVAKSMMAGLAGKLAMLTNEVNPELAGRLRSGATKFVGASARLGAQNNANDKNDTNNAMG